MTDSTALALLVVLGVLLVAVGVLWAIDHNRLRDIIARTRDEAGDHRRDAVTVVAQRKALSGIGRGTVQGDVAGFVVNAVAEILRTDAVCLFRFTGTHARLVAAAGPGAIHETSRTFNVPFESDPLIDAIVSSEGPVHARSYSVSDELRFQYLSQRFVGGAGVPIVGEAGLTGALIVHLGPGDPDLPPDWSETLAAFADLALLADAVPSASVGLLGASVEETLAVIPHPVVIHDESMVFTYANPVALSYYGAPGELVGRPIAEHLFPAVYDMHEYLMRTRATEGMSYTAIWINHRSSAETIYMRVTVVPIHTSHGMLILMVAAEATDQITAERERIVLLETERQAHAQATAATSDALARIDDLRSLQSVLRNEVELLRLALEMETDWVIALDGERRVFYLNDAARDWLQLERGAVLGMPIDEVFSGGGAEALTAVVTQVAGHRASMAVPLHMVRGDQEADVVWTLAALPGSGKEPVVIAVARTQVSGEDGLRALDLLLARKQAAQLRAVRMHGELEKQSRRRQEVDASKDDVLALISHDLRTPLTSILGYTDLLLGERSGLDSRHRRFVKIIARSGERLMELVDDLLLVAQHQSGALTVAPKPMLVAPVVVQSVTAAHPEATSKEIVVSVDTPEDLVVMADPVRIGQVLDNLVANAVKYTQRGGSVRISAVREDDWVRFRVSDNGPGIPEQDLGRIFDRFTRARDDTDGGVKGFGLGLTIAHAIVEAHGGEIGVESTPGIGSTFWFTLPAVDDDTVLADG